MSWNIEVGCLRGPKKRLDDLAPDVFTATKEHVGFEEATSSSRPPDLCIGKVGAWIVALDAGCRLSAAREHLRAASRGGELYVVRIGAAPNELLYSDGKRARLSTAATQEPDGELRAMGWLKERTGLSFADDLWAARYQVFTVDG